MSRASLIHGKERTAGVSHIEDKLPRGMPYPHQVADQIAADMIASGQVRMQMWELLCDALPGGDPRREACADLPRMLCASPVEPILNSRYLDYAGTPPCCPGSHFWSSSTSVHALM